MSDVGLRCASCGREIGDRDVVTTIPVVTIEHFHVACRHHQPPGHVDGQDARARGRDGHPRGRDDGGDTRCVSCGESLRRDSFYMVSVDDGQRVCVKCWEAES